VTVTARPRQKADFSVKISAQQTLDPDCHNACETFNYPRGEYNFLDMATVNITLFPVAEKIKSEIDASLMIN
jgi:hypothetical protein